VQFSSTFFEKVSNKTKSKISRFYFDCIQERASEISRHVSFIIDIKLKLVKQKELIETELVADSDSDAYEEDSSVEDNEVEVELWEEQEASVGDESN
jgi:hypothetical protein